ncbi:MAG TPA: glycosyltransferase family 2 protein [Candidatus Dojkabacteria bacterium]|nr:glycosyltransferase family 2 protein [Candidatus Dojkabacteria bacterium]
MLVNDDSKDESVEIIKEYKEHFPDKIVFLTQPYSGVARARNYGLNEANGYYIVFVDSDDYIDPSYVNTLVEELDSNKAECVVSGFRRVSKTGKVLYTRKISHQEWGKYSTILMCGRAYKVLSLKRNNIIKFLGNSEHNNILKMEKKTVRE